MEGDSSIQEKAIAIFRWHAEIAENQKLWDELPVTYEINGMWLWIDMENGMISIENPNLFSVKNPKHLEAIEIAQEIYSELACLRGIFFYCEDGEINEEVFWRHGGFSEDAVSEDWEYVQSMLGNPYYQSAPRGYRERISAVIVKYAEYIAAFPKHQKARQLEAMRSSINHGFVYLLDSTVGYWKIGRSGVPVQRISKLEVKLPFDLEVQALIETADMYHLESSLHDRYEAKRVRGEWFRLDADDISYIKSLAVQA